MNEDTGDIVIAYGGAGAAVCRRVGDRLRGQHARPGIVGEWRAQTLAVRPRNERKLAPAGGTQSARIGDLFPARWAQRRQRGVERETERSADRVGNLTPERPCRTGK